MWAEKKGVEDIHQVNIGYLLSWIDYFCIF